MEEVIDTIRDMAQCLYSIVGTMIILAIIPALPVILGRITITLNPQSQTPVNSDIPEFIDHGAPKFSLPDLNIAQKIINLIHFIKSIITTIINTLKSITMALINFCKFTGIYYKNQNEFLKLLQTAIVLFVFNLKQNFKINYQGCA